MTEFKTGQTVIYFPVYGLESVCRIKKITKSGVIELEPYEDGYCPTCKFDHDGWEKRGRRDKWFHLSRIEVLPPGETADSICEKIYDKVAAQTKERDEKERIRQETIKNWWESKGKHIWDAKIILPVQFMGHPVYALQFEDGFESRMPLIIVRDTEEGVAIACGGLYGSYREEGKEDIISAYTTSNAGGRTLEEALYRLIR